MRVLLLLGLMAAGQTPYKKKTVIDFSDLVIDGQLVLPEGSFLSARPGGAQDAEYFRDRARAGEVPRSETITAEGLFAGHDLPLARRPSCAVLLCPGAEAARVQLASRPEITHLVQIGMTSGLRELVRGPLNLIAVVDRSGSMSGEKLALVKETLAVIATKLTAADRLSLVTFADEAEIALHPTSDRWLIDRAIRAIESNGG